MRSWRLTVHFDQFLGGTPDGTPIFRLGLHVSEEEHVVCLDALLFKLSGNVSRLTEEIH